jgi:tetratricopeptide (TPR) repeat protein
LKRAINQGDTAADAHHDLGLVLFGRGQLDEAIHEFQTALLNEGNDAEAHRNLGRALYESGALDEARKEFETAILQREGSSVAADAIAAGRAGTQPSAEGKTSILGSESEKTSKGARETTIIAAASAQSAGGSNSRPVYTPFPEAHLDLGRVLYDQGHSDEAIAELQKAIAVRAIFPRAHYELGRAFVRAGRLGEALTELKTAIEQQGGVFAEAHFQNGLLLSRQGYMDSALDSYQTAIKQSGGVYPEAYYHMGQDHVRVRNTEAAVLAYRKAIEQRGGYFPEAHQDLGRVLYSIGELEAANEEYSIAVRQRTPRKEGTASDEAHSDRGKARKARRTEVITEDFEKALRQAPAAADVGKGPEAMAEHAPAREASSQGARNE